LSTTFPPFVAFATGIFATEGRLFPKNFYKAEESDFFGVFGVKSHTNHSAFSLISGTSVFPENPKIIKKFSTILLCFRKTGVFLKQTEPNPSFR